MSIEARSERIDFLESVDTRETVDVVVPLVALAWQSVQRRLWKQIAGRRLPGHPVDDPDPFVEWSASLVRVMHEPDETTARDIHANIARFASVDALGRSWILSGLRRRGFDPANDVHVAALWYAHVNQLPIVAIWHFVVPAAVGGGATPMQAAKLAEEVFARAFPDGPAWAAGAWNVVRQAVPFYLKEQTGVEIDTLAGPRDGLPATAAARAADAWQNLAGDAFSAFMGQPPPGLSIARSGLEQIYGPRAETAIEAVKRDAWRRLERKAAPYVRSSTRPDQRVVKEVPASSIAGEIAQMPAASLPPDDSLAEAELRSRVMEELDGLDPQDQALVRGRAVNQRSFRDLARELGGDHKTLASRYEEAVRKIRFRAGFQEI
jgi:hypothetical protein